MFSTVSHPTLSNFLFLILNKFENYLRVFQAMLARLVLAHCGKFILVCRSPRFTKGIVDIPPQLQIV